MRRYISILPGLAIVVLLGVLVGCSQSPIGLFESIALERKIIDDRALENDLVVGAIAESTNNYFIAAGTLWYRNVVDADYPAGEVAQWEAITSPGTSNFTTSSLTVFNGTGTELVYVAYSSQDGTEGGIYVLDPAGEFGPLTADDKVFGTEVTDVAGVGKVFVADDGIATYLLVGARKTGTSRYSVYASTTGAAGSFVEVAGTDRNLPVIDVAANATGTVAFLTQKLILIDSDGLNAGAGDVTDITGNLAVGDRQPEFGGIYYHPTTDTLWLTDNDGFLYHSDDFGSIWSSNGTAHLVSTSNEDPLQFTDMTAVNNGGTQLLVVGTEGHGYRELNAVNFSPATPAAEVSNYQASKLAEATILTFYVDADSTVYVPVQS
ncbi:MAG: hypothetical protein KAU31_04275, partial [Spirochaetaceae bacterium]|nr:hypothetical protein [Spirochaetaceae bacterium]